MGIEFSFSEKFDEAHRKINAHAKEKMQQATMEVRNKALETLSGRRSGRVYRVAGTRRTYVASAPGEPPAQQTSNLRKSVTTSLEGSGRILVGSVGSHVIYAPMLEFGTRKMAARPWLKPSFQDVDIKAIFGKAWF